jgi:DNA-binding MarR family transcriptional regulator
MAYSAQNGKILLTLMFQTKRQIIVKMRKEKNLNLLSFLQAETLEYIGKQEQPTMKEVSNFLCITPPSATSIIDNLVKSKMLERIPDEKDRRIVWLRVTQQGRSLVQTHCLAITAQMEKILDNLDETEQIQLLNIYKKISKLYS